MSNNVLFIHHVSFMGGAERYLLSLVEILDRKYKVFFICQEPGPLSEAMKNLGVSVHFMPLRAWRKFRYAIANLFTLKSILDFCKSHDIHLICSNNYRVTSYAIWPAKVLRIPVITIIQDFVSRSKLRKFNTFHSDYLITVSESITHSVCQYFRKGITRIYNGIDADAFINALQPGEVLKKEFPALEGKRIVGMIAQVVPLKGHKVFLEAMRVIAQEFDDVMFVIIGDSPDEGQLSLKDIKAYAQEFQISDRVICTGTRKDAHSLLKSFDILVHPAYKEPFGRVIMEAMVLSVPVVATDSGGPGEIIEDGHSGIVVPVGDTRAIGDAVKRLLSMKQMRLFMGINGRKRIEQFNLKNTVMNINAFFDKILKS